MIDVLEALHSFINEGISWASGIAIVLAILKIRDANHSRKLRAQTARDIAEIKGALGLWNATTLNRSSVDGQTKRGRLFLSRWVGRYRAVPAGPYIISRRKRPMKEINWVTLTTALMSAAKLVLQVFGIDVITDDLINSTVNAVAAVVAVVGVIMSHSKKVAKEEIKDEFRAPIEPSA